MTLLFSDSFDYYATIAEMGNGYWDAATTGTNASLTTGRFTGSQAYGVGAITTGTVLLYKSSGSNDQTHHIVCGFEQAVGLSGTVSGMALTFLDGTSAQCSIVFRSDGAILLTSGAGSGSTLATYTSAFSANTWTAFEFEVTIDNTAGVFRARKNGNTVNDFQATNLNTRAGTTNSYANKLQIAFTTNTTPLNVTNTQLIDDLLWFSATGAAPNTWVGDVRAYQLMPTTDVSTQFSKSTGSTYVLTPYTFSGGQAVTAGQARYAVFTATYDGAIGSAAVNLATGYTGNMKCALFASSGSAPTTVIQSATAVISNPVTGNNSFSFSPAVSVTKGTQYYLSFDSDVTSGTWSVASAGSNTGGTSTTAYASFPVASPGFAASANPVVVTINITVGSNSTLTAETQEDGSASYVYSSSVGATDFYNVADLPGTPASIIAVTTRGYGQKSDAGTRIGQMQMKSGSTTVQTGAAGLATSFTWQSRTDTTDPNTGQTWTASGVNALQIGPTVGG